MNSINPTELDKYNIGDYIKLCVINPRKTEPSYEEGVIKFKKTDEEPILEFMYDESGTVVGSSVRSNCIVIKQKDGRTIGFSLDRIISISGAVQEQQP